MHNVSTNLEPATALYVSSRLSIRELAASSHTRDRFVEDGEEFRLLTPEWYAWLRVRMERAFASRLAGRLDADTWEAMQRRFSDMDARAVTLYGGKALRDAVAGFSAPEETEALGSEATCPEGHSGASRRHQPLRPGSVTVAKTTGNASAGGTNGSSPVIVSGPPRENHLLAAGYQEIVTNVHQVRDVIRYAWDALVARNSCGLPFIFAHADRVVGLHTPPESDAIHVEQLTPCGMYVVLVDHIDWVRITKRGRKIPWKPDKDVAWMMLSSPDPRLPLLSSVMAEWGYEPDPGISSDSRRRAREGRALIYRKATPQAGTLPTPDLTTRRPNNRGSNV